jgi:CRP-like cAMP-binding protein
VTLDHDVLLLKSIPLLADFSVEQLRLIAFSAEPHTLPPGTILFREGAEAEGGYLVLSGAVRLVRERGGVAEEVAVAGPGALIGELALLCPTTRPVTAEIIEPTELYAITRRLLRRVLQEYPEMAERMRASLSLRLRALMDELGHTRARLLAVDGADPAARR